MKRIIILASILVALIITTCIVYFNTNNTATNSNEDVVVSDVDEAYYVEDIPVKQSLEEADKSVSDVINNDTNVIVFDTVEYTNISNNLTENIFDFTGTEERNLIYTLVTSWSNTGGFSPSDVEYVSDNFGQGYEEIIINIRYENNSAEIHYTYNDNGIEGYLKDTTDKE